MTYVPNLGKMPGQAVAGCTPNLCTLAYATGWITLSSKCLLLDWFAFECKVSNSSMAASAHGVRIVASFTSPAGMLEMRMASTKLGAF